MEDSLQSGIDEMILVLKEKGYSEDDDLYWFKDPEAKHFEKDWSERIWRALIFMFGNDQSYGLIYKD